MIRFLTAGESHGKALNTIVEGFPSNLPLSAGFINNELSRRQRGYGRGTRMKIENDSVEVLSGIRFGKTLGSPISMIIRNSDFENWKEVMQTGNESQKPEPVTLPRPGHADLTGTLKYNYDDIRNSIERSSARETASRVAAGSVAKRFLSEFGIFVGSFVESVGSIFSDNNMTQVYLKNNDIPFLSAEELNAEADKSELRVLDKDQEEKIVEKIRTAKKSGDTLGGTFCVIATGVPAGLGSFVHYDKKINASLAAAMMSINAVKGVEIGAGFYAGDNFGSEVHDEIIFSANMFSRKTNNAGGIEGGITTGLPVIIRCVMKPISTLMSPLMSIDLRNLSVSESRRERSDFVAVPSCSVIAESMAAWVIADFFLNKFGGDSLEEVKAHFSGYNERIIENLKKNFEK